MTVEIFFRDLKEEVQNDIIKTFGDVETDFNWSVFPMCTIEIDETVEDQEENN